MPMINTVNREPIIRLNELVTDKGDFKSTSQIFIDNKTVAVGRREKWELLMDNADDILFFFIVPELLLRKPELFEVEIG